MTAIVIRGNTKATWLIGVADLRAKASGVGRRAMDCAAAGAMVCVVGDTAPAFAMPNCIQAC